MIKKILGILLLSVVSNANPMYRGQDITENTAFITQAMKAYRSSLPRIEETEIPESLRITNFLLRFCPLPKEEIQGAEDLHRKIDDLVNQKKELKLYMPSFPCKSLSRKKCINDTPDLGEYLALKTLEHMCEEITKIYRPGASIIIVSDGHIYQNEIVAPTSIITLYHGYLQHIIRRHRIQRVTFQDGLSLDQRIDSPEKLRDEVGKEIEGSWSSEDEETAHDMFSFVKKDLYPGKTRKTKLSREETEVINAIVRDLMLSTKKYGQFLKRYFPESTTIRLSVHPHNDVSKKLGINLIYGLRGTPWHNSVMLLQSEPAFTLINDIDIFDSELWNGLAYIKQDIPITLLQQRFEAEAREKRSNHACPWRLLNQ